MDNDFTVKPLPLDDDEIKPLPLDLAIEATPLPLDDEVKPLPLDYDFSVPLPLVEEITPIEGLQMYDPFAEVAEVEKPVPNVQMYDPFAEVAEAEKSITNVQMYDPFAEVAEVEKAVPNVQIYDPFAEVAEIENAVPNVQIYDPFAEVAEIENAVPNVQMYDPFAKEDVQEFDTIQNSFLLDEPTLKTFNTPTRDIAEQKNYDDELDFSLDEPILTPPTKFASNSASKSASAPEQNDTRFDDIEEISFDEIKVATTAKKTLDDIETAVFDDIKIETTVKATLDDVEDVNFTEAEYKAEKVEKKTLDDIDAPDLAVEEKPKTDYKPKFVDPSLEEAKKSAKANANKAALSSNNVDPRKQLESMREFQRERERELAQQGFGLVFLLMFFGIIACGAFYLFSTEIITPFKEDALFSNKIRQYIPYGCGVTLLFSILLIVPSKGLKGFASFCYFLMFLASLGLGIPMLVAGKESITLINIALAIVPPILFLANLITLGSNDKIECFYKRKDE
ncbi:hypothetical protein FACS1894132_10760 [Clostridia bacterium]|nr:hypothetical protein FACS1894132_10760 [Clostridia bacterium]